ncbi:MAG: type III secretion inner membrane ring lipoprotein SctJ [Paludibacterium sp.]|uniref:type III secretion system inner membrane ring lipoprotein SctJ n=1 Tax=Paludibacterium sp. TaxID=1917523 RepID=UPI0025F14672|nr:type III secretion inner membrane ring lipoprotein SctJ [Paludibacterium sp.]MBV8047532.1 type III secretion inner membrane ring lipoprotein SctJ [Paludibacterium sp.]MBV8649601.1 type III secretion inner membrane ring lipoprotein SctJ [Paludibacterium sp.]
MTGRRWLGLLLLLTLVGCKTDLYSRLDEVEANRMMALLLSYRIPVDKQREKDGITLRVDEARFVDAVELLRQNGLPGKRLAGIEDLFPSGQLVTSPEQEAAKLRYVKSQQMEKMLANIEGVISAEVSVAPKNAGDDAAAAPMSAAVFIKYSPTVNLEARESEIRALVSDGIPGMAPERVSLVLQRTLLRLSDPPEPTAFLRWPVVAALVALASLAIGAGALLWRSRRAS